MLEFLARRALDNFTENTDAADAGQRHFLGLQTGRQHLEILKTAAKGVNQ